MSTTDLTQTFRDIVREEIRNLVPDMLAHFPRPSADDGPRTLTINQLRARYGIGRQQINALIRSGQLPATPRVMRSGHEGFVVHVIDAERVLGGAE